MKPTYEQLEQELIELRNENLKLREFLKSALERIARLEDQINRNSKNSSKSPSSDNKGNTSKNTERKDRKARQGIARPLYPPERVNQHVDCTRTNCPHCNSTELLFLQKSPAIWQQVELPAVQAIVTQFNCYRYCCAGCGQRSIGNLPEGTPFSAFGPKLMALIVTLTGNFHLSKREAISLINNLYGIELSEGSVINIEENVANALDAVYERIHSCVIQGKLTRHFDETSWRDCGKRHYVWIATNIEAAYYRIDPSRSQEAFFKIVGSHTKAPSVTDRYNVYNAIDGPHQYCLAHLIREFHAFAEQPGETGQIGGKIEQELRKACGVHSKWRKGTISLKQRNLYLAHSKRRLDNLFTDAIGFGCSALAELCMRLDEDYEHLWTFVSIEGMEPTNNLAERDLRKLVLWRKKSYGTRSIRGQRFVERICSVVETIKKNGKNVLNFLEEAIQAFYQRKPAPYINLAIGI